MSAAQKIWILEQYQSPLRKVNEDKDESTQRWIFEGPCADFNEENDNGRMYDKDDYLSHFSYLLPQIESNALAGELDHADDYNPKMKDLSHVVRKLWYREDLNQVWIRIELFEEGEGKKAIEYAKKGMPLYISSRASGYIDDDGNVTLDTIYTYDIVYRPGFKVAELKKTTNTSESKVIRLFESSKKYSNQTSAIMLLEWKELDENKKINNKKKTISDMEQNNKDINKPATRGDLNQIYETINQQITLLKKAINLDGNDLHVKSGLQFLGESKNNKKSVLENKDDIEKIGESLSEKFVSRAEFSELFNKFEAILKWSELVRQAVNEHDDINKKHHKHINMVISRINEMSEIDSENISNVVNQLKKDTAVLKKYADINTEFVNGIADKQELMHEHANLTVTHVNKMTENINNHDESINGMKSDINVMNEHANLSTGFINGINEKIKNMSKRVNEELDAEKIYKVLGDFESKYDLVDNSIILLDPTISDEVSSKLSAAGFKNTKESDTKLIINEELDEKTGEVKIVSSPDINTEKINKVLDEFEGASLTGSNIMFSDPTIIDDVASKLSAAGIKNKKEDNKLVLESKKIATGKGKININKVNKRVDEAILSSKKKIADKMIDKVVEKYPYVSVLENSEIVNFSKLNDVKKKIISDKVYENGTDNRGALLGIIRSVNSDKGVIRMLSNMPNRIKPVWNKLDKNQRQQVISLYNIKSFNDDLEIKAWWESMNIGGASLQKMNENRVEFDNVELETGTESDLGYGSDDIDKSLQI